MNLSSPPHVTLHHAMIATSYNLGDQSKHPLLHVALMSKLKQRL